MTCARCGDQRFVCKFMTTGREHGCSAGDSCMNIRRPCPDCTAKPAVEATAIEQCVCGHAKSQHREVASTNLPPTVLACMVPSCACAGLGTAAASDGGTLARGPDQAELLSSWLHSFDHSDRAAWPLLVEEMRKTVGGLRPERDSFIPPPPPPEPEKPEPEARGAERARALINDMSEDAVAYEASATRAMAVSGNYVADDAVHPKRVTFANGRTVWIGEDGSLQVGWVAQAEKAKAGR